MTNGPTWSPVAGATVSNELHGSGQGDGKEPGLRVGRTLLRDLGAVAVIAAVGLSAGCAASDSHHVNLHGSRVEVLGAWSGTEQVRFEAVLAGFRRATGAQVRYLSARGHVREVLDARLRAGAAPDVALLPQPGLIRAYVEAGRLVPLDTATRNVVEQHYAPVWQHLATVGGRLYGVWFKAADKSLMWYSVGDFERAGVVPPDNLDGLLASFERVASCRSASAAPTPGR